MFKKAAIYFTEGMPPRSSFVPGIRGMGQYLNRVFTDMPPGLIRIMKIQPIFALTSAALCILLFRRGFEYVPVVFVLVLVSFFFIILRVYRQWESAGVRGRMADALLLFILNDMLLFVVPFYLESMTIRSVNVLYIIILACLVLIINWYYIYDKWISKSPLRTSVLYALVFFSVLNVVLPVVFAMRSFWNVVISGIIALLFMFIFIYPHMHIHKNKKNSRLVTAGIVLVLAALTAGRSIIPPVPLRLMSTTAATGVADNNPLEPFRVLEYDSPREIYFFTSVFAPRGLRDDISHVWYRNEKKLFSVTLKDIRGGRRRGFRTWSRHLALEGAGVYTVEVWNGGGQFLGKGSFVLEQPPAGETGEREKAI
ncbi:MAG: hypothetical protein CVV44_04965 [Spirochaetae bacterium HGW-Spirochaetae-1]|jgi:hypothetical protein|nr:MAG: hypothetical protein CVV44_04965 [Spirochaetae bacterium HGW-Spirochaetae-1]